MCVDANEKFNEEMAICIFDYLVCLHSHGDCIQKSRVQLHDSILVN